ncbi:COMM domain-containing protein 3 [Corapipo altera]|uniref:COMM domain-containing protein 3 n=1 Tax=Corapipo altera TaxID=415028 RepID=UPI000FD6B2C6|nr:COMM domain-containing protein 3 [Corapipo altera]
MDARVPAGPGGCPRVSPPADGSRVPLRGVSPLTRDCFIKAPTRQKQRGGRAGPPLAFVSAGVGQSGGVPPLPPCGGFFACGHVLRQPCLILDDPDLKDIDPTVLKHCHAAAATCILEAGKQKADISAISTCLEDCKLDKERIEQFCTEYQKNKDALEILLGSIGRSPLHITDVSWRLEYQIKNNQLHKTYQPSYLVTLNVENSDSGSHPDVSFSCTMEQLQDLVGKLKDAAKSLERATQM